MKILFICDEYPPGRNGGIGTAVQVLGRELVKQGHSVYVAGLYRYRYGEANYEEDRGVKVWRHRFGINLGAKANPYLYDLFEKLPPLFRKHLNGKRAFRNYIRFINQLIETEHIDVIEIPDWNNFAFFIGFVVQWPLFKVPLIVKSHGSYTKIFRDLNKKTGGIFAQTDLELYKRGDAFAAVSHDTAEANTLIFHPQKAIRVLYNAIELPTVTSATVRKKQRALFIGSLSEAKGLFQLMKAWNIVHEKLPGAELVVYGKGKTEPAEKLLNTAARSSVSFKGHVNREVLFTALSEATLGVFPSYSETFGLMTIEAMSMGCPVIYTKRSCGPEIVQNGENGILVEPDNVPEIADAVIELIKNETLQHSYSQNALKTVAHKFNIVSSAKEHISYYTEVIREFKPILKN